MDNELKQDLTRRLSQCNRGGLILVMYDIYFAYSDDAKKALEMGDDQAFKKGIENAQAGLDELIGALDFKYPITDQLFSLYSYCKKQLSKAIYEKTVEKIAEADTIMKKLRGSFKIAAEQDTSGLRCHFPKWQRHSNGNLFENYGGLRQNFQSGYAGNQVPWW